MSVNVYDPVNDTLIPVAGATLYAEMPLGAIQAFDSTDIPSNFLEFKGQTVNRADYPDLWAHIVKNSLFGEGKFYGIGDGATTFTLADLRETSLKGYGETSRSVGAHVKSGGLGIGEFLDDRIQQHNHYAFVADQGTIHEYGAAYSTTLGRLNTLSVDPNTARTGPTTEVKAVGVVWAVKARQTGLPIDLKAEVDKIATRFPDYARGSLYTTATSSYTMPEDGYVIFVVYSSSTSLSLLINDTEVSTRDFDTGLCVTQFNGYVKKGSVVKRSDNATMQVSYFKVFGLTS